MPATLRPDALPAALARGRIAPLYALVGDEPLQAIESADAIRAAARAQGWDERVVLTVQPNFDWSELLAASRAGGLFAAKRIVELRMPAGKTYRGGAEALARWCELLDGDTLVGIVTLPRPDGATRQAAWFKALESRAVMVPCEPIAAADLPRWIARRLAAQGQSADDESLRFLADCFEGNLIAARQEIDKLALLCGRGRIEPAVLVELVAQVARYDPAGLAEALAGGDLARIVRMVDGFEAEGVSPVLLLYMLQQDLRALAAVSAALEEGRTLDDALRAAGVWGPRKLLVTHGAQRARPRRWRALVARAAAVDLITKGLPQPDWPREPWAALRQLIVELVETLRPRRTPRPALKAR
jgi:DNA polymerase-3 subunit delta